MTIIWLAFLLSVGMIGIAGSRLTRYSDIIADQLNISKSWIGLVLLATVTSLPELITGISAIRFADAPNIAVGDVLGSCVFNLFILAFLDVIHRGESFYSRVSYGHTLSAGLGIVLISFAGVNILLAQHGYGLNFAHVGFYTPIIIVIYAFSMRIVFRYEQAQATQFFEKTVEANTVIPLKTAILRYAGAAMVVVAAGAALPFIGQEIAEVMGWHTTFVGTLFIAFATSVPEVVVTMAALRIGALDMAISNVLGSNLFDILIIAIDDLIFTKGPLLSHVSPSHALTALFAVLMSGIVIVGLLYRSKSKVFNIAGWTSVILFLIYMFNAYILYLRQE